MDLKQLFGIKAQLEQYPEKQFASLAAMVGVHNPVLFVSDAEALRRATYFSLNTTEDTGYTIYVVTHESGVLFYVIEVKTPFWVLTRNGLIVRTRKRWQEASDMAGVSVRYQFNDFSVISNANQTAAVFARNISSIPTT